MKRISVLLVVSISLFAQAQEKRSPVTLRSILLEQLRTTHNSKDWFVDVNTAVAGLTPEQASWKQGAGNHSVGQLAYHLVFWNERELHKFDAKQWASIQQRLDQVMTELEKIVEAADEKQLESWASELAHIGTHNAYHTGQIVFVRKLQGSWDPEKGVK